MVRVPTFEQKASAAVRAVGIPRWLLLVLALVLSLWSLPAAAASGEIAPFCTPGSGPGKCDGPGGVTVDTETGHVYVADAGNQRANVFESGGAFLTSFGGGELSSPAWVAIDNDPASSSRHDVYVSTSGFAVKKFKPTGELVTSFGGKGDGTPEKCQLERVNDPIAVGPNGNVYVADSYEKGVNVFVNRIIVFGPAGGCLEEVSLFEGKFETIRNFAVDSTGNLYVTVAGAGGVIRKYSPAGVLDYELDKGTETEGLAVDAADDLFAKQRGDLVTRQATDFFLTEYSSTGEKLRRFDYRIGGNFVVPALAAYHSAEGDLYASEGEQGVKYLKLPSPGPVVVPEACKVKTDGLGNVKATLQAEVNPEGKPTTFKFEYLTQAQFEKEGGFHNAQASAVGALPADFELHEATIRAEGLVPETKYYCRIATENADSITPTVGEEGTFTTKEGFEFGPVWSTGVGETSATVFAEGSPLGVHATGQVEYVEDAKYQASKFAEAQSAPTPELDYGESEEMQAPSVILMGLHPGTLYHYRLRARNGTPPEGIVCPGHKIECPEFEHTLRTYLPEAGEVDQRRYELVSPGEKNSAEVGIPGNGAGFHEDRFTRIQAAATSGEAITYTSWTSFGAAEGAPATSQYLAKRVEGTGWVTQNISPRGFIANALMPPYSDFTPDLRFAALKTTAPRLTSDCRTTEDLYLRDNETGELRCLDQEGSGSPESACLVYGGASDDGSRVFMAGKPEGGENFTYSLYEWTKDGVKPVSILPGGEMAPATEGTSFGPLGSTNGVENCKATRTMLRHAISGDGSKAFWTYVPASTSEPSRLLVRVDGSETLQLDKKQSGAGTGTGDGVFRAASTDGSVAYFTDINRLVAGAKAGPGESDLYRYELGGSEPLSDLTKSAGTAGDVQGVVGVSDDGAYAYFVAEAVLSGEEENKAGEKAKEGADNLYLFHEGKASFIATLSGEDAADWSSEPRELRARVTPDGKHLAFLTTEAQKLAGYDNTIVNGKHCQYGLTLEGEVELSGSPECPQAFLYDAENGALSCVSCNPAGARPLGPTFLPGWTNGVEGPRFLSDNGSRFFFDSFDALLPADSNGKSDVYEFERPGEGSCSAASSNFDPISGGCHFLVSDGKSSDESYLVDASADGRDVFFSTRQKLVGWDVNDNFDIYDYREGGGFLEPPAKLTVCEEEAVCKPSPTPAPSVFSPPTASFQGIGNLSPSIPVASPVRCGKGLTSKNGKCVKQPAKCKKGLVKEKGKCIKGKRAQRKRKLHEQKKRNKGARR